ncbi:class I SAM-dependent methyltransferase [Gracilibacillus timonensis]|uniref:class I SAM-dependent methyltransferase n=1 Tax=Gracilibacillus timonensis TaxID=1816696 RepID=UPI0008253FAF|nr:class I SAM-dependent methyltransferase [Gracilibacillus timonensis]
MSEQIYDVWWDNDKREAEMETAHQNGWKDTISLMKEKDLSAYSVLDFGCNRGGFLRTLYQEKPFKEGIGIDLGTESIQIAEERKQGLPLHYMTTGVPGKTGKTFDIGFCLSVIYLIEDLEDHAQKIKQVLNTGGAYYITYTELPKNKSFPYFKESIEGYSKLQVQSHTIDDIAFAFMQEGFQVEVQRKIPNGFISISGEQNGFRSIHDQLISQYEQAYLFRMTLPS